MSTPASKVRSQYWFVRIDGEKEFLRQKCRELSTGIDVEACLSGYHTGKTKENPHAHICLALHDGNTPQKQTIAVRLKALFKIEKKSQYALEVWDNDREKGAPSYIYHESDVEVFTSKGFSESQLAAAKTANEAIQKVVAMNKEKAQNKLVERALKEFEGVYHPSRVDLLEFMLKCIKDGENYHPGTFMLKRYVEEVELKLLPGNQLREYASHLENILWR